MKLQNYFTKGELALEQDKIGEVGPIKYIAELIYGDDAKDYFDKHEWVIIVLIFVFDIGNIIIDAA